MKKIQITLDLNRIDKNRIKLRQYQNQSGETVTVKEYILDVVELEQPKQIAEGATWILQQTHFVVDASTKEEREAQTKMKTIGKGTGFINKVSEPVQQVKQDIKQKLGANMGFPEDEMSSQELADSIPF